MITLYSKPNCPQCAATKRHLKNLNISFIETLITPENADTIKELGYLTAPVVYIDDSVHWSGYRPDLLDSLRGKNEN